MESPPVSPSSPTASDGSSLRNFLKTNHPEPLLSFSSETLADNAGSISPDHLIPPTGQFPYYRGSGTFLETISAHMRSRPTQAISQSTQRRYAQAILAAMPVDGRDPDWAKGINGAAGGLWEAGGRMFAEEEFSMQLRQHSEVFYFLPVGYAGF